MSEHDEQTKLFQILAMYEEKYPDLQWVHAIPNGGKRHIGTAMKMKAEGVKRGIWDVFVPIWKAPAHGLYIEMKFGKNKLTAEQNEFGKFANMIGCFETAVCYSGVDAANVIFEYLGMKERIE